MKVLVTGASGFVGRALVTALATSNHRVRAAIRRRERYDVTDDVDIVCLGDLTAPIDWAPALADIEAVVHLAGIAHVGQDVPESLYDRVNHLATAELARAARRAGVARLVFVSSIRAQSGPTADHVLTEADEPRPTDPYGRSKLAAETAVRDCGVSFTILRPVLIYGPGVGGNFAALMRLAALPLPLPFASFHNRRSLLDRDNMIGAIQFVLENPVADRQLYVVADPKPISLAEIIAWLRRGLGKHPGLLPVPPAVFKMLLRLLARNDMWDRLGGSLVVAPEKLIAAGWRPNPDTEQAILATARAIAAARQ
jgi:nucleoside-diphosphate-sugar epimerase